MKKVVVLMAVIAIFGLGACHSKQEPAKQETVDIHNSETSLDWEGVYTGTIPSASGSGINVRLKIGADEKFELNYEYVGKPDTFTWTGSFKWDDAGSIIILDKEDIPHYYKVAENKLIQFDMEGKEITGSLADDYILKKEQ